jgi:Fe-S-cluster-containing dehydrogenase component/CheY-like chemotaxis protein
MPHAARILVVTDSAKDRCRLRASLTSPDHTVETAGSRTWRQALAAGSFDLVVADLVPDGSPDSLRRVAAEAPGALVIALLAEPTAAAVARAVDARAFDCVACKASPQELQTAAAIALRARSTTAGATGAVRGPWIQVRPELCYACLGCTVACAFANLGLPEDASLRPAMLAAARLSVEASGGYSVPLLCLQCEDAPCMAVCAAGALQRPEPNAPVAVDAARCIGCRRCVLACPLGVLTLDEDNRVVQKCSLCSRRRQAGQKPACVASCPTAALQWIEGREG